MSVIPPPTSLSQPALGVYNNSSYNTGYSNYFPESPAPPVPARLPQYAPPSQVPKEASSGPGLIARAFNGLFRQNITAIILFIACSAFLFHMSIILQSYSADNRDEKNKNEPFIIGSIVVGTLLLIYTFVRFLLIFKIFSCPVDKLLNDMVDEPIPTSCY